MNYYKKNTALETIKKRKIASILEDLNNNFCFDCSNINPEYISINNGIFLCRNCMQNHLKLPKSISYIIKNNINDLSMKNIQYLTYGGNKNLKEFIFKNFPDLIKLSPKYFYQTYALDYYRKTIEYLVEGGNKPIKPDIYDGYELIKIKEEDNNINNKQKLYFNIKKNNMKLVRKIKSDSLIKFINSPYPKIKPIVGRNSQIQFNNFSNQKRNNNQLSQIASNFQRDKYYDYSFDNNKNYPKFHMKSNSTFSSITANKRIFYPNFKNNYDVDDENINLSNINGTIYEYNNTNSMINKKNIKLREKFLKKNNLNKYFKNLNLNPTVKNSFNNNIYARYMSQNYLNMNKNNKNQNNLYKNNNLYNIDRMNNTTFFNYGKRDINNMDLRTYLLNKSRENENHIYNLKLNPAKPMLINKEEINEIKNNKNTNINNINNNIIINRNLNVFYNNNNSYNNNSYTNNNDPQKIFKKKPIVNNFYLKQQNNTLNDYDYSIEKLNYFNSTNNIEDNNFNNPKKHNKKIVKRNKDDTIKVNKIKTNSGINTGTNYTNSNTNSIGNFHIKVERNFFNNDINNKTYNNQLDKNEGLIQESKIIQRISRVIKIQKERQEKLKSSLYNKEIKDKDNHRELDNSNKNKNNLKFKIINVEKIKKEKNKENNKEKEKEKIKQNIKSKESNNKAKEIKIKIYKRNDKTYSTNNLIDPPKTIHSIMRELNNLPSGKKKNFVEIIKSNILYNKSVSPGVQRILKMSNKA